MATLNLKQLLATICLHILAVGHAQHVKVEPNVSGYIGGEAVLRCQFVDPGQELQVTQVTWMKDPSGAKVNMAVHNPQLGTNYPTDTGGRVHFRQASLQDASLVIERLEMGDDGIYSCEFATYPDGNQEAATNLTILAKPQNSANALLERARPSEVPVAVCTSANGKPAASITWRGYVPGNVSTTQTRNSDGTVTVKSEYKAVPSGEIDGQTMTCVVDQRTLTQPETIPITLLVQYPPIVTIEGYDDNWYLAREHAALTCNVKANPSATEFKWLMNGEPVPQSVEVHGHQLTVAEVNYDVNGTFTCEAVNTLGTGRGKMDVIVREREAAQPSNAGAIAGGVIGGILALLIIACLVGFFLQKRRRGPAGSYDPKTRVFGARNGAPQPDYTYRPDSDSEKGPSVATATTTEAQDHREAQDLLKSQPPTYENYSEEEEKRGEPASENELMLQLPDRDGVEPWVEDDMESQRDGSIISKKAVYV
ncbi:PVR cell adhesion molecule related 2 like isoform X1 [Heptranchias perlo]|uniref:PVR cell adhesion molecule related 2 like isoform X1 n=1 Tax=Heptranchias perlo TaxID=212740 RepID=UPI003559E2CB